jgi:hypothetical protein
MRFSGRASTASCGKLSMRDMLNSAFSKGVGAGLKPAPNYRCVGSLIMLMRIIMMILIIVISIIIPRPKAAGSG